MSDDNFSIDVLLTDKFPITSLHMRCVSEDLVATFDPFLRVLLALMVGVTDLPFRKLVARFRSGLVLSEMIASQEMVVCRVESQEKVELGSRVSHSAIRLAGGEAHWMAEAARMAAANCAKLFDINIGCPVKKFVSGYSGLELLKDLDHALCIIDIVVNSVKVPASLKPASDGKRDYIVHPILPAVQKTAVLS